MKKLLALLLLIPSLVFGATASFTADTTSLIINPERGFYVSLKDNEMVTSTINGFVSQYSTRLMHYRIALDAYQSTDTIPGAFLTTLTGYFTQARAANVKMVVIVSYDNAGSGPVVTTARMVSHAGQLRSFFYANRDIISFVKAGFLGNYGEWWGATNGVDTKASKRAIKDAVMAMVPPEIQVAFTQVYPMQEDWYPVALTAAQAFTGSAQARTGWHNDCFMSGPTDSFQFPGATTVSDFTVTKSQAQQRQYVAGITEYASSGGELSTSCNTPHRTGCTSSTSDGAGQSGGVLNEFPRYHVTWLNVPIGGSNDPFKDTWVSGGCWNTVTNFMGYRLQLDSLSHADTVSRGAVLTVTLNARNVGWARFLFERRPTVTLTKSAETDIVCTSANDLRKLPSQATSSTQMQVKCAIPIGASTGSYAMHLSFPDRQASLATIRAYKVRPANANSGGQVWDDTNGRFTTGTTVTVN